MGKCEGNVHMIIETRCRRCKKEFQVKEYFWLDTETIISYCEGCIRTDIGAKDNMVLVRYKKPNVYSAEFPVNNKGINLNGGTLHVTRFANEYSSQTVKLNNVKRVEVKKDRKKIITSVFNFRNDCIANLDEFESTNIVEVEILDLFDGLHFLYQKQRD